MLGSCCSNPRVGDDIKTWVNSNKIKTCVEGFLKNKGSLITDCTQVIHARSLSLEYTHFPLSISIY